MPPRDGPIAVDLQALQAPSSRARGIGEYARSYVRALERHAPGLVGAYLLNPALAPPAPFEELTQSGKVAWWGEEGALGPSARVLHLLSPLDPELEIGALWPRAAGHLPLSATVYDLIPTHDLDAAFIDPVARRRYRTRLELVRNADGLQVLAAGVGRELTARLGVDPVRIARIGAAVDPELARPADPALASSLLERIGVRGPYVLYPSGTHPRKNNEALAHGFARSDARSLGYQLVIAGDFPASTIHHLEALGGRSGAEGVIVVPGFLEAAEFRALVQRAALVCFPSLAEGYGLPVAEAIAVGIPVIAADRSPLDELVAEEARFEPTSVPAIAAAIARALRAPPPPPDRSVLDTDEDVAARAAAAFATLLRAPRLRRRERALAPPRRHRPRVALVSPFPPAATGIAAYSDELARALLALDRVELSLFGDGPTPDQRGPGGEPVAPAGALLARESLLGAFDGVVYSLGNSHHHLGALRVLRERPGVVLAHDVRLTNLYRHLHGDPGFALGGLGREIAAMYEERLPPGLGRTGALDQRDADRYGVLMAREAIRASTRFLVSSATARSLALLDAGPGFGDHVAVLPFAFFDPDHAPAFEEERRPAPDELGVTARYWGRAPDGALPPVLAHFGIVDPVKEPELMISALSLLRARGRAAVLVLVGPIADELARSLAVLARSAGVEDGLMFTGPLGPGEYRAWLDHASVAVQLRRASNGEASAALGECLMAGVATVVRAGGFFAELPGDAVARLGRLDGAEELAVVLGALLGDETRRASLGAAGRAYASSRSFRATASVLAETLERLTPPPGLARPA